MFLPIDVVLAVPVRVDDGDELEVLPGHEPGPYLTLSLGAAADLGQGDPRSANEVKRTSGGFLTLAS